MRYNPYIVTLRMTTPRFGDITVDTNDSNTTNTTITTKDFWDSILTGMKFDKNVWIIWNGIGHHYRMKHSSGNCINEAYHHDIYMIDNYFNKYKIIPTHEEIEVLQKKKNGNVTYLFTGIMKNTTIKTGTTYDTPLSDEEIIYIKKYCTINDTENMDVFKRKMKDYFTLHTDTTMETKVSELENKLQICIESVGLIRSYQEHMKKYDAKISEQQITIVHQSKMIKTLEHKNTELQKKQEDDSGFISYLKKLFAWN